MLIESQVDADVPHIAFGLIGPTRTVIYTASFDRLGDDTLLATDPNKVMDSCVTTVVDIEQVDVSSSPSGASVFRGVGERSEVSQFSL